MTYSRRPVNSTGPISSSSSRYSSTGASEPLPPAAACASLARVRCCCISDVEAVEVDGAAALLGDLTREVDGEPERVVEEEGIVPAHVAAREHVVEEVEAAREGLPKALLLARDDAAGHVVLARRAPG